MANERILLKGKSGCDKHSQCYNSSRGHGYRGCGNLEPAQEQASRKGLNILGVLRYPLSSNTGTELPYQTSDAGLVRAMCLKP